MDNLVGRQSSAATIQEDDAEDSRTGRFVQPRGSVYETTDSVVVELEIPGVDRDKIDVTVERDKLTVTGWRKPEGVGTFEILHQERFPLRYQRSFILGETIDSSRVNASYVDGVLKLTLFKAETAKPRKISIQ
jgi:HSP20 family protein